MKPDESLTEGVRTVILTTYISATVTVKEATLIFYFKPT